MRDNFFFIFFLSLESAYEPVWSSNVLIPKDLRLLIWSKSGSIKQATLILELEIKSNNFSIFFAFALIFKPPSVVTSSLFSGTKQTDLGFNFKAF